MFIMPSMKISKKKTRRRTMKPTRRSEELDRLDDRSYPLLALLRHHFLMRISSKCSKLKGSSLAFDMRSSKKISEKNSKKSFLLSLTRTKRTARLLLSQGKRSEESMTIRVKEESTRTSRRSQKQNRIRPSQVSVTVSKSMTRLRLIGKNRSSFRTKSRLNSR